MTYPPPPTRLAHHAMPAWDSAATRHLCAGAYLDESFHLASLREAYFQPKRLVAPSYGYELTKVLGHCLRARRAAIIRDSIIVGLLVIALCTLQFGIVFLAGSLLQLYVVVALARLVRTSTEQLRAGESIGLGAIVSRGIKLFVALMVVSLLWGLLWLISFASFFSGDGEQLALIYVLVTLFTLAMPVVPLVTNVWRQHQITRFVPGRGIGDPPSSRRFEEIREQQRGNTVVYSGYRPFVGSGEVIDTWGFAQRLVRAYNGTGIPNAELEREGEREFEQAPFTAYEIIVHVAGQLRSLATDPVPERHLPGLTVDDQVFLAGTEVGHLSPVTTPERMAEVIRHPTTPARYYLACRVVSWNGELVTSVYIHFAVQGRSLYLEITTTALPPCDERFRVVDYVEGTNALAYLRAAAKGVADAPRTVAVAPVNLAWAIVDSVAASVRSTTDGPLFRGFDYGARLSVRELGASPVTRNHVQTQDVLKHKRIIERRVVASVLDFLESRGVDTSEYRQRAATILNAGAVNVGSGSMVVQTAVGQQNQPSASAHPAGR